MNASFHAAMCQQVIWLNDPVMTFAVGFVTVALDLHYRGLPAGADDVPDSARCANHHVEGSAIAMLREATVIKDSFAFLPEHGIHGGRRKSKRESARGRKVCTYELASLAAATEFLRRNGVEITRQAELAFS